jgi:hypothetical protein
VAGRGHRGAGCGALQLHQGDGPVVLDYSDGRAEFFRHESLLTAAISALPELVVCLYYLERSGAEVLMDTLRARPRMTADGMICDNPLLHRAGQVSHHAGATR